jgi:flavin reductase (DIM6/NTAB) family NADH-FMN oxidoreductase RutF
MRPGAEVLSMAIQLLDPSFFADVHAAPGAVDEAPDMRALRNAFGCFATGVAVVTAEAPSGRKSAATINSFSSVSLDPPLLLLCLARQSRSLDVMQDARRLAVQFLRDDQRDLAMQFATPGDEKLEGVAWGRTRRGVLCLDKALAVLDCDLRQFVPGGDHRIVVAEVMDVDVTANGAEPLMFYRGKFLGAES